MSYRSLDSDKPSKVLGLIDKYCFISLIFPKISCAGSSSGSAASDVALFLVRERSSCQRKGKSLVHQVTDYVCRLSATRMNSDTFQSVRLCEVGINLNSLTLM